MEIRRMVARVVPRGQAHRQTDRQTDRRESTSHFSQFRERVQQSDILLLLK
jgi:hypothetical protein